MKGMSLWIALAASWIVGLVMVLVAGDPWAAHAGTARGERSTFAVDQVMDAGP